MSRFIWVFLVLILAALPAIAAEGINMKSVAEVDVVSKNAKGETIVQRIDAAKANIVPGDTVLFTTFYTNLGDQAAARLVIDNPLPEQVAYVDKSAEGKKTRIEFSIDGGKSYAPPGQLKIRQADGRERPATAADYTHIRWILEGALEKGGAGSVSFKGKVK